MLRKFRCVKCLFTSDAWAMQKHVMQAKHLFVEAVGLGLAVRCVECAEREVSKLMLVRYGGDEFKIVCKSCPACQNEACENMRFALEEGFFQLTSVLALVQCDHCLKEIYTVEPGQDVFLCDACRHLTGADASFSLSEARSCAIEAVVSLKIEQIEQLSLSGSVDDSQQLGKSSPGMSAALEGQLRSSTDNGNISQNATVEVSSNVAPRKYIPPHSRKKDAVVFPDLVAYHNYVIPELAQRLFRSIEPMVQFELLQANGKHLYVHIDRSSPELNHPEFALRPHYAPFSLKQAVVLSNLDISTIWFAYIKTQDVNDDDIVLELCLYPFKQPILKVRYGGPKFKLWPGRAIETQQLQAMVRLKDSPYLDFALGNNMTISRPLSKPLQLNNVKLNYSQTRAVTTAMEDTTTFIEGPPGSGKTSVIEEIILQKLERQEDCPILCVAESNIAIDNICQRLLIDHSDINMVRAVSIVREQEYPIWHELGPFCLHNLVQRELSADLWAIKKEIEANGPNSVSASDYLNLRKVQGSSIKRIVANADIVFATTVQAGRVFAQTGREFGTVIMDESTQAPECSSMIPVSLPGVKRIVLVGDKEQLSSTDIIRRLPNSFFKRALEAKACNRSIFLDIQYRMHPLIAEFPSQVFYHGMLKNGILPATRSWPEVSHPLILQNVNSNTGEISIRQFEQCHGFSYSNEEEAMAVISAVKCLIFDKRVAREDIGIITFYSAQRELISSYLECDFMINPKSMPLERYSSLDMSEPNGQVKTSSESYTIGSVNGITVSSVDAFQGHEKDFVILSCVRSNMDNNIGFLSDRRRLNVALTRAKYGLIIIGNKDVLSQGGKLWRNFIWHLEVRNFITDNLDVL